MARHIIKTESPEVQAAAIIAASRSLATAYKPDASGKTKSIALTEMTHQILELFDYENQRIKAAGNAE